MDAAAALRSQRTRAGLTQSALAARAGTSQATVAAYETGAKQPSLATLSRLLGVLGARLAIEPRPGSVLEPSPAQLERAGRTLVEVLALADALPVRHERFRRFPRLSAAAGRPA